MSNSYVAYSGWIGHNNIGDEAIFESITQLFPNHEFVNANYVSSYDDLLIGGGTVLPNRGILKTGPRAAYSNAAIGVGVRNPCFWNQRFGTFDVGYLLHKYKLSQLNNNQYIRYLLTGLEKEFDPILYQNHIIGIEAFDKTKQFDFDYLGVRGPISHCILNEHSIPNTISGDTALFLEPSNYVDSPSNKIAVTLRSGNYQWDKDGAYHRAVMKFCQRHQDEYEFVFLPFHPSDLQVNIHIMKKVKNAYLIDHCSYVKVQDTLDVISGCDLMIGDKLHACVLAACCYVPFISMEYRPKNLDFACSVGMDQYNVRTDVVTSDILEKLAQSLLDNPEIRKQLKNNVSYYRKQLVNFSNSIQNCINSHQCRDQQTGV